MVVPLLAEGLERGVTNIPHLFTIIKIVAAVGLIYFLKRYFGGATCTSEREMHGKVMLITVRTMLDMTALSDRSREVHQA